jgi:hypothetical protein
MISIDWGVCNLEATYSSSPTMRFASQLNSAVGTRLSPPTDPHKPPRAVLNAGQQVGVHRSDGGIRHPDDDTVRRCYGVAPHR